MVDPKAHHPTGLVSIDGRTPRVVTADQSPQGTRCGSVVVDDLIARLRNCDGLLTTAGRVSRGKDGLETPGLYPWWVDAAGVKGQWVVPVGGQWFCPPAWVSLLIQV